MHHAPPIQSLMLAIVFLACALALASAASDPDHRLYARLGDLFTSQLASFESDGTSSLTLFDGHANFAYGIGYCDGWIWGAENVANVSNNQYQVMKVRVADGSRFSVGPVTTGGAVACDCKAGRIYMVGREGIFSMRNDGTDLQTFFQFPTPFMSGRMMYFIMRDGIAYYRLTETGGAERPGIRASSNKTGNTIVLRWDDYVGGLDVHDGMLYFTNESWVMRASAVDGSGVEVLGGPFDHSLGIRGLAVYNEKIIVGSGNGIYSLNLDGTGNTKLYNVTGDVGGGCLITYEHQASSSSDACSVERSWLRSLLAFVGFLG